MKNAIAAIAFAVLTAAATAAAQTQAGADRPTFRHKIAINQGKWDEIRYGQWQLPEVERNGLQAVLIEKLQKSGQFVVMEREISGERQMDEERAIKNAAGAARPQARQAARYVLTPEVTAFEFKSSGGHKMSFGGVSLGDKRSKVTFRLSIRIVDSETSQTLDVATGEAVQETKESAFNPSGLLRGIASYDESKTSSKGYGKVFDEAIGKAVAEVCSRIGKQSWSARVVQVASTGRLAINAGASSGVGVGQQFGVYRVSGRIVDPETGEVLSAGDETLIGHVRVARSEQGIAFCDVVGGKGFSASDVVRPE